MKRLNLSDLSIGMLATSRREVTKQTVRDFGNASGDFNPIHFDDESAREAGFKACIAHGMLIASFVSEVIGMELPGPGSIAKSLALTFSRPVYVDSTVDIKVEITNITANHRLALVELTATCSVEGKDVIRGTGSVNFPLDK